jgi:hypothetical protein
VWCLRCGTVLARMQEVLIPLSYQYIPLPVCADLVLKNEEITSELFLRMVYVAHKAPIFMLPHCFVCLHNLLVFIININFRQKREKKHRSCVAVGVVDKK